MLAEARQEWQRFRDDRAGRRFRNHHDRMQRTARALKVARLVLGIALIAGGLVMLVVPGPGLLVSVFGLALISGASEKVARALDRAEPPLRRAWARVKRRWRALDAGTRTVILIGAGLVGIGALGLIAWWWLA